MEYKTKQKEMILLYLQERKDYAVSALDIIKKLENQVSKATIYRNLDQLEKEDKIRKFYNEQTSTYEYQICSQDNECYHHLHLKCIVCGKSIHLHCPSSDQFLSHIGKEHNFTISPNNNTLYGICSSCNLVKGARK